MPLQSGYDAPVNFVPLAPPEAFQRELIRSSDGGSDVRIFKKSDSKAYEYDSIVYLVENGNG